MRNYTMPSRIGAVGRASVVFPRQPDAADVFADFVDDAILQSH